MANPTSEAIDGKALGRAMGVFWAHTIAVLGLTARHGWRDEWRDLLADICLGYDSTDKGRVVGAVWAFADAFVGGYLLAWLYNRFRRSME